MRVSNDTIASSPVNMTTSWTSDPIWLGHLRDFSIQLFFTGTPVGVFRLQCSNDRETNVETAAGVNNWSIMSGSTQTIDEAGDHTWTIDVNVPTPEGGATEAKQDTANTSLSSIDTKLSSVATTAKQDTGNTSLASIDGKLASTANGLKVDGSAVTQPISGSVSVSNLPATQPVSGSVSVSNFPATQAVSGTVTANVQGGNSTAVKVDGSAVTQPVSGSVSVSNFPSSQNVIATNSLVNVAYNQIVISAVNASNNPTTILFKQSGTTVATLTIAYDALGAVQSVTRS